MKYKNPADMYTIYNIYRIFCCQAYDKKVRWTFFSRFFNYFTMSGFSNTSSAVAANAFVAV